MAIISITNEVVFKIDIIRIMVVLRLIFIPHFNWWFFNWWLFNRWHDSWLHGWIHRRWHDNWRHNYWRLIIHLWLLHIHSWLLLINDSSIVYNRHIWFWFISRRWNHFFAICTPHFKLKVYNFRYRECFYSISNADFICWL